MMAAYLRLRTSVVCGTIGVVTGYISGKYVMLQSLHGNLQFGILPLFFARSAVPGFLFGLAILLVFWKLNSLKSTRALWLPLISAACSVSAISTTGLLTPINWQFLDPIVTSVAKGETRLEVLPIVAPSVSATVAVFIFSWLLIYCIDRVSETAHSDKVTVTAGMGAVVATFCGPAFLLPDGIIVLVTVWQSIMLALIGWRMTNRSRGAP